MQKRQSLWRTLVTLKGNQKYALYTEPMWGIAFNLYVPFAAVYMAALGLSPVQIGLISTINIVSQMLASTVAGVLTDKLGRRRCVVLSDMIAWVAPYLLWGFANGFWWFVFAAITNGFWRISNVAFNLLIVEEAEEDKLIHLFSLNNIAGLLAGFFSPLAYLLVRRYTLVPTMRGIYLMGAALLLIKNYILYTRTHDTQTAIQRMAETKALRVTQMLLDSRGILRRMVQNRRILLAMGIMAVWLAMKNVTDNFWPLFLTDALNIPSETLSLYNTARSLTMLAASVLISSRIRLNSFLKPLLFAFGLYVLVDLFYLLLPANSAVPVAFGTMAEAIAMSMLVPLTSSLEASVMDEHERARMLSFSAMLCLLLTSPFGALAGVLSKANRAFPLVLNIFLALTGAYLTLTLGRCRTAAPAKGGQP